MEPDSNQLPLLALDNFDPRGDPTRPLESPRSLQACEMMGIDPQDLFLLDERELELRLQNEGTDPSELDSVKENYYQRIQEILQDLVQLRQHIVDGTLDQLQTQEAPRRYPHKKRRRRRKRNRAAVRKPALGEVDQFLANQIKDLHHTINVESEKTKKLIKNKRSKKQLLSQEKHRLIKRLRIKESKCGYPGIFDIQGLKVNLRGVTTIRKLKELETYLTNLLHNRIDMEKHMKKITRQEESKFLEELSLDQKEQLLNQKIYELNQKMEEEQILNKKRGLNSGWIHSEKLHIAHLRRQIEEARFREENYIKEIRSLYFRRQAQLQSYNKQKRKAKKQEIKMKRNQVIREMRGEEEEEKQAMLLQKLREDEYNYMVFKLKQENEQKHSTLRALEADQHRQEIQQKKELIEMDKAQRTQARRMMKDQLVAQNIQDLNRQQMEKVINTENWYMTKKEKIKEQKAQEEFLRGFQFSKIFQDNERHLIKKQTDNYLKNEKRNFLVKMENKKRQIKHIFDTIRKPENLPEDRNELSDITETIYENVVSSALNDAGIAVEANSAPKKKRKKKKSRKSKKEKAQSGKRKAAVGTVSTKARKGSKKSKKRGKKRVNRQQAQEEEEALMMQQAIEQHPEIQEIIQQEQEKIQILEDQLQVIEDEEEQQRIMEEAQAIHQEASQRIEQILAGGQIDDDADYVDIEGDEGADL